MALPLMAVMLSHCTRATESSWEIVEISKLPHPDTVPYPNGAAVCLCQNQEGEKALIAIMAVEKRSVREKFQDLKTGQSFSANLVPWAERPPEARAMFVANDFEDHFDLPFHFAIW